MRKPKFHSKSSKTVIAYYRVLKTVTIFFSDPVKAQDWMFTPNMWLGGISPLDMIDAGRTHKVEQFIISQLDDNGQTGQIGFKGQE